MVAGLSIGTELRRFKKGKMPKIALLAIVLMPLLYGAMYLWAFWNPFGQVQHLPIALVNNDRGAVVEGTALNAGTEITDQLLAGGDLDWQTVTAEEAQDGVKHGRYYFALEIPAGFSAAVASPMSADPRQAQLEVTFNDANNYLSTVIGESAMNQVLAAVTEKISAQAVDKVLVGLQTAGDGIAQAADGAHQLNDGAAQLDEGAQQLGDGLNTAESGSAELATGAATLSEGIDTASVGASALASGLGQLNTGAAQLGDGATQISGGIDTLVGTLDPVAQAQQEALTSVQQVANLLRANPDPLSRQAVTALDQLSGTLSTEGFNQSMVGQLFQLRDGARQLATELGDPSSQFRGGLSQAGTGANELSSGLIQLSDGGHRLTTGATDLHSGLIQLSDGAVTLADGTSQLRDGSGELATKLTEGADSVPKWNDAERLKVASTVGAPVALSTMSMTHAPTFGTGFAPFFLPLALFVGCIIIWMLMRPLQTRALSTRLSSLRVVAASYWPALWIVIAQVTVMFLVVRFAVGLHPAHTFGMVAFLLLIAATYLALIQAFNIVLGVSVGRVVTLAFLMVQLVSSGGVYPVETTGKLFQILHPVNPMSYAVNGLRQLTLGGIDQRLWTAIAVLIGVLVVSLAASSLAVRRDRRWSIERLHPPLQV
ncbi:YhgE/Pip domain-containing protein [Tomitella biformata]|uniref:YhgE/Pip domain-containing protein n=1 Tax=Tomitella biformata TaxID=630403 RepID=UPI000464D722|nr:YhgE/Pip domain-containing protein [Tomitella biformata]